MFDKGQKKDGLVFSLPPHLIAMTMFKLLPTVTPFLFSLLKRIGREELGIHTQHQFHVE